MKLLITTIAFLLLTLTAKSEDYDVLWEMDFSPHAGFVYVTDDGKYFYYTDEGYVKFRDSKSGSLISQIPDRKFLILGRQNYNLDNDKVVLPFTLDSILIYDIAKQETESIINL